MSRRKLSWVSSIFGAAFGTLSCTAMVAITLTGILGILGVQASLNFLSPVDSLLRPVWQPLLLASLALVVFGVSRAGSLSLVLSVTGSVLSYLGMFLMMFSAVGTTHGTANMMDMLGGTQGTGGNTALSLALFWPGVTLLIVTMIRAHRPGWLKALKISAQLEKKQ